MLQQKGFCLTFWQLIKYLRPYPAALLMLLSITETALVAKGVRAWTSVRKLNALCKPQAGVLPQLVR